MKYDKALHPTIKVQAKVTLGHDTPAFQLEKRRAAIKAALRSALAGLAATTSGLVAQTGTAQALDDGGTPPWGEVIIGPIWEERNPPELSHTIIEAAEIKFWE